MTKYPDVTELYRRIEEVRKTKAKRSVAEKLAIASRLRDAQERLAALRQANKARRRKKLTNQDFT